MKHAILDSSAWIELLDEGPNTTHFRPVLMRITELIVPSVTITEVRKVVLKQRGKEKADQVTHSMRSGIIAPIDTEIATLAADLFIQYRLPLADSLIYSVTLTHKATLWTQDSHFEGLPHVRYFTKIKP